MKLVKYRGIKENDNDLLKSVVECLTKGYDTQPLFSDSAVVYKQGFQGGYALEKLSLFDEPESEQEPSCYPCLFNDIEPAGYDISKFIIFNSEQLKEIIEGFLLVDVNVYAKPEFDDRQMSQIRRGLEAGVDVSVYAKPEFDLHQMKQIRLGFEEGVDVSVYAKPELSAVRMSAIRYLLSSGVQIADLRNVESMPDSLLKYTAIAYDRLGSAVIDVLKKYSDFYSELMKIDLKGEETNNVFISEIYENTFLILITGQVLGVFNPEDYKITEMNADEVRPLVAQTFENAKQKIVEMFYQSLEKSGISRTSYDYVTDTAVKRFNSLQIESDDIWMLMQMAGLSIQNNYLWQFFLMANLWKDDKLFQKGLKFFRQAGIPPDEYIYSIRNFAHTEELQNISDSMDWFLRHELQKMGVKMEKDALEGTDLLDFYCSCKDAYEKNIKLKMNIKSYATTVKAEVVIKYLQKGVDVSKHIPSMSKILRANSRIRYDFDYNKYGRTYDMLSHLLVQYNVNLFSEITEVLMKIRENRVHAVIDTLKYVTALLGSEQQTRQRCAEMLIEQVKQNNCFDAGQIRQLYYGVLHGVDVSKYANPDYPADVMAVIREGLEQNIDLTPYVREIDDSNRNTEGIRLRHLLRILTGMAPQNTDVSVSNNVGITKK